MELFQPSSGAEALTLSDRRRIQNQIQYFLDNRSRHSERSDGVASSSSINLFGSTIGNTPSFQFPEHMARGSKIGCKRKTRNKVRLEQKGSDEPDEDYNIDEDEEFNIDVDEDYCSSLAEDESEESLGGFDDEEEEWVQKKVKNEKAEKPRVGRGVQTRKKNGAVKPKRKNVVHSDEGEDTDDYYPSSGAKQRKKSKPKDNRAENPATRKKKTIKEWGWGRRKKTTVSSDSDFVSSASDYEYTVSEEEREQVREANALCRRLASNTRGSSSLKMIKEEEPLPPKRKCPVRKGKRKVVDLNIEIGKQVCGICLSEEGKRTVRGVLNCCSHYFCFACIMEWSKVESRCPLCRQRFTTISRTARAEGGHDLRDAVFPIPERDQVYQPSEEELRGYLDLVGLFQPSSPSSGAGALTLSDRRRIQRQIQYFLNNRSRQSERSDVVSLSSSINLFQPSSPSSEAGALTLSDRRRIQRQIQYFLNNRSRQSERSDVVASSSSINLFQPSSPSSGAGALTLSDRRRIQRQIQYFLNNRSRQSERSDVVASSSSINLFQPSSPSSGAGAFTLSDRRRIQRQIQYFLTNRSRQSERSDGVASSSSINLFGSTIGRGVVATQSTVMPSRMGPQNMYLQGRLAEYSTPLFYNREATRLSSLREETVHVHNQASTSNGHNFNGLPQSEFSGVNARMMGGGLGHQQLHPCSATSNNGPGANTPSFQFQKATGVPSRTLQGSLHRPF